MPGLQMDRYTPAQRNVIDRVRRETGHVRVALVAQVGGPIRVEALDDTRIVSATIVLPDGTERHPDTWEGGDR